MTKRTHGASVLGQLLAAQPARLLAGNYTLLHPSHLRYSDLDGDVLSRVGVAHLFEDMRTHVGRDVLGPQRKEYDETHARWRSLLRLVSIEFLAQADADSPLEMTGGISHVGRTSHRMAMALFQRGRCVALGESTNVTIGADHRPAPIPAPLREVMQAALMTALPPATPAPDPQALPTLAAYPFTHELPTRFADTDAVGHLNNVAVSRYHDNAFMAFQRAVLGRHTRAGQAGHWQTTRHVVAMQAENFHRQNMGMGLGVAALHEHHFTLAQALFQHGQCTGTAWMNVACTDDQGNTTALGPALRSALMPWLITEQEP